MYFFTGTQLSSIFVDIDGRAKYVDFLEDTAVLLQNHADQHGFAGLAGAEEDTCAWYQGHHGVRGLLTAILGRRKQLDLPHTSFALLPKFDAGKPGSESGINLKAGMRLKYMGSKSWLAPHVDRLLGDVGAILCVAQEWLEQSCCQRRIEAAILCPTQDCQARTRPAPGPHQARTRQ